MLASKNRRRGGTGDWQQICLYRAAKKPVIELPQAKK